MPEPDDLDRRVTALEWLIRGPDGENGIRSNVRKLDKQFEALSNKIEMLERKVEKGNSDIVNMLGMREEKERKAKNAAAWRFVGAGLTFLSVLVAAIAVVVEATGHATGHS